MKKALLTVFGTGLRNRLPIVAFALAAICAGPASALTIIYSDAFDTTEAEWGNQLGDWTTSGGSYYAQNPSNNPLTYSLLPYTVTDFTVELNISGPNDGGIYLRANADRSRGVLLIFGGLAHTGTGLYWHIGPDYETIVNPTPQGLLSHDTTAHLRIVVTGNLYEAYLNGGTDPVTSLIDNSVSSGYIGLYDLTGGFGGQTFDNLVLAAAVPEASTVMMAIIGLGLVVIAKIPRRKS